MHRRSRTASLCAATAVAVFSAACGGSSGGDGDSNAANRTGSSSSSNSAPTGEPILLALQANTTGPAAAPAIFLSAQAAVDSINAAGGVKSKAGGAARPLKLLTCDSNSFADPSKAETCARQAVSSGAVLSVSDFSLGGADAKVLTKAGMAELGAFPFDVAALTTPGVYPFVLGPGLNIGGAGLLVSDGATSIQVTALSVGAAASLAAQVKQFFEKKVHVLDPVLLPADPSADLTPLWAKVASQKADGVAVYPPHGYMTKELQGLKTAGYKGKLVSTVINLPESHEWTSDYNGLNLASSFDSVNNTANPTIAAYRADLAKYAPKSAVDEWSLNSWLSVKLAASIAGTLDTIDRPSFMKAIQGKKVDLGVAPPFTLGVKDPNFPLPLPNQFRGTVSYQVVKDLKTVNAGDGAFHDIDTGQTTPLIPCNDCPKLTE